MNIFTKIKHYLGDFKDDVKAARRGEKRIAPRGQGLRGRVYARPGDEEGAAFNRVLVSRSPTATLTMVVTRADGTVETIKVPASAVQVSEQ
jgi:hypothetical protein